MNVVQEVHTSEIIDPCPRRGYLRKQGHGGVDATVALVRGIVTHTCLEHLHLGSRWDTPARELVERCAPVSRERIIGEGRVLSRAVVDGWDGMVGDIAEVVGHYQERFKGYFSTCKLLAVEAPIRHEFKRGDTWVNFASHLDLLFRDAEGQVWVWDWKFHSESPSPSYLNRNLQFAAYALAVARGSVCVDLLDEQWVEFGEWPRTAWIHLPALKPYKRKTTVRQGDGDEVVYKKGDLRPLDRVVQEAWIDGVRADVIERDIALRVEMLASGLCVPIPGTNCGWCDVAQHCESYAPLTGGGS